MILQEQPLLEAASGQASPARDFDAESRALMQDIMQMRSQVETVANQPPTNADPSVLQEMAQQIGTLNEHNAALDQRLRVALQEKETLQLQKESLQQQLHEANQHTKQIADAVRKPEMAPLSGVTAMYFRLWETLHSDLRNSVVQQPHAEVECMMT